MTAAAVPCSTASTPSSARRRRRFAARCASSPARARARPGPSRTASPTPCAPAPSRPGQLLAVTFTARAAGELRSRLRRLGADGVQARTFHAAALRQLTYFAPRVLGGAMPEVVDNPLRLVGAAASRVRLRADRTELRDLAAEIEWAKAVLVAPEDYPARATSAGREPPTSAATVAAVYAEYEAAKRRVGQLDFADLLLIMAGAIEEYARRRRGDPIPVPAFRRRRVPGRLAACNSGCSTPGWAAATTCASSVTPTRRSTPSPGRRPSTCCRFTRRFPERCGRAVAPRLPVHASGGRAGEPARRHGRGQRCADRGCDSWASARTARAPTFAEFDDEPAEAADVAARCRALIDAGTPASEVAVLFRVNAQSEVYEQALAERPGAIRPARRRAVLRPTRDPRGAVAAARGAARAEADEATLPDAVRGVLASLGWHPDDPPPGGAARERWESLAALVSLADDLVALDAQAHLPELVAELDQRATAQHAPTVQGVTLASLHAAKGLEWDVVFLVGLTDGTVPIQRASTADQVAEERRLLYVGMTRARERLGLSWALARSPGQRRSRRPSRFLDGLRPVAFANTPSRRNGNLRPQADDAELFGRLRAWRKRQAEALSVPAYVVFSDATLVAISDSRPSDRSELARVSGIGPSKLDRYGEPLLAVLSGADPEAVNLVIDTG